MVKYSFPTFRSRFSKTMLLILVGIVVLTSGTVITIRKVYTDNLRALNTSQQSHLITVPSGASTKEIGAILKKANLIRSSWAFEWYIRNHNLRDRLQAGTYSLRPSLSIEQIADVLTEGRVDVGLVTILPAQRIDQIKQVFINKYGFDPKDVDDSLNPDNYVDHPALVDKPRGASLEGYLYPESFQKTADTKPETIVRQSLDEMQKHLTPELRTGIVRQGLTVHEGVILASIIEQEVGKQSDRATVAQVFLKRRQMDMPLGSDVTAFYGAIKDGKTPSLTYDSPYNTLIHKGLPPGPISNVSDSSLQAVANPSPTDYLYFVAGDDGITYFSHTLQEHEALTQAHCKKLCNQ
jgi:UPF0755 protein